MSAAPPRPPSLTLTCVFVGVGSLLLLVELMGLLSNWGSVELQDTIREGLSSEPLAGAGIELEQALSWLRWLAYVGLVVAVCGGVFALYTARGHQASRILLTVLCALAAFTFAAGGVAGLLPAIFAAVCGTSLWTPDTRQWFDAVAGKEGSSSAEPAGRTSGGGAGRSTTGQSSRPDPFSAQSPAPASTVDDQTPEVDASHSGQDATGQDTAEQHSTGQDAGAPAPMSGPRARPKAARLAAVITLVSCAVVAAAGLLTLFVSTLGADVYRQALDEPGLAQDLLRTSGLSADDVIGMLRWASITWLVMSAVGAVAAVATLRRQVAGVVLLRLSSILTVAVSVLFLPVGIVTAAAAVIVFLQVRQPEVTAWVRDGR